MRSDQTIDEFIDSLTDEEYDTWERRCFTLRSAQCEVDRLRGQLRELTKEVNQAEGKLKRAHTWYFKFMDQLKAKGE